VPKQPHVKQQWDGNLKHDAQSLVMLLQVGCVKPNTKEVTSEGYFELF